MCPVPPPQGPSGWGIRGRALVEHDFFLAGRYLEYGVGNDLLRLEADLAVKSAMTEVALGGGRLWVVPIEAALDVGMKGLARRNAYYLLQKSPTFVEGQIPCDGLTTQRKRAIPRCFLAWYRD